MSNLFFALYEIPDSFTNSGVTVINNHDGTLTITGAATGSARWIVPNVASADGGLTDATRFPGIKWLPNGKYLFSHAAGAPVRIGAVRYPTAGTGTGATAQTTNTQHGTMELTIDDTYAFNTIGLYVPANSNPTCVLTPVITAENGYIISDTLANGIAAAIKTKTGLASVKGSDMPSAIMSIGGGGGTLIQKTVTANGVYNASDDSADGYSKVTVNVPASAVDSGTKSITQNGAGQDVVGYAAVDVNVPNSYAAGDEGKVVQNGALVSQTSDTVTQNGTVDTTLINSLIVNVQGGGGSGLTYEEGTYTAASDALPVISFANSHAAAPDFIVFIDASQAIPAVGNAGTYFVYINALSAFGVEFNRDASNKWQTFFTYGRLNGSLAFQSGTNKYARGNIKNVSFEPWFDSGSYACKSGQTYKWIAIWR